VTNADAAIAASGRERGRIHLRIGHVDPEFLRAWKTALRTLRLPALHGWRYELVCSDDGEGVDADIVDQRLGALGVVPETAGQRGLFGRGLRDVWLAQGGGRLQGVRGERAVESWFLPGGGDEPYVYTHMLDTRATRAIRRELRIAREGTRVTVPLADGRLPPNARLRRLFADLVQLRPILEDDTRELLLELPGEPLQLVRYTLPEPDPERPVLFDDEVELQRGITARVVVRRAAQPIPLSPALPRASDNAVFRVDVATNTVAAKIDVGRYPTSVAVMQGAVWVVNAGGPTVSRIDPVTNRVVATIRLAPAKAASDRGAVTAGDGALWVSVASQDTLVRMDPATNQVTARIHVSAEPCAFLAADSRSVWASGGHCSPTITRVDPRRQRETQVVRGEIAPIGLSLGFGSPWVADIERKTIDRVDPRTGHVVARLPVGGIPIRLAVGFGSVWVRDDTGRVLRIRPQS
jgi:YVTN family beta-propeller protein